MRSRNVVAILALCWGICPAFEPEAPITKDAAEAIALSVAGCQKEDLCTAGASFVDGAWLVSVVRVRPKDKNSGSGPPTPIIVAAKLDAQGHLLKRYPPG
jgi:hypothetical protein